MNSATKTYSLNLFSEKQRFTQWWMWAIFVVGIGLSGYDLLQTIFRGATIGNPPDDTRGAVLAFTIVLLVILFLLSIQLETQIKEEGIYVRLFPFHLKFKYFPWEQLAKIYVRKYSPIKEYGGWGLRWSIFGSGKAYNIRGDIGLQLIFMDGKKLLIGTQNPEELKKVLIQMDRLKP